MRLHGNVVWKCGDSIGIVFRKQSPNHDMLV